MRDLTETDMANHDSGPSPPKGGGLWARLFGVGVDESNDNREPAEEILPQWDVVPPSPLVSSPVYAKVVLRPSWSVWVRTRPFVSYLFTTSCGVGDADWFGVRSVSSRWLAS